VPDSMKPGVFYYALHVKCACFREVIGPARRNDEPEFSPEVVEGFFAAIREHGWSQSESGAWTCGERCPGVPPWVEELRRRPMPPGLLSRYKIKTINPNFFGTTTIKNLKN